MIRTKNEIMEAIKNMETLPAFPDVLLRFQTEMSNDHPDIRKLAAIVEDDPVLTARFLKAVNSAYYSRSSSVASVAQSINRLGLLETRRIAITTALVDRFRELGGIIPRAFWTHSIAVALTSRAILDIGTHSFTAEDADTAYIACLLHDIGVIVLFQLFETEYRMEYQHQLDAGGINTENELSQFGIHHGEAGALLVSNWKLPAVLHDPILHHHQPALANAASKPLCMLVHLSDFVCNNIGAARMETRISTTFDESAFELFHLSLDMVPDIVEHVKKQAAAAESLVDLR